MECLPVIRRHKNNTTNYSTTSECVLCWALLIAIVYYQVYSRSRNATLNYGIQILSVCLCRWRQIIWYSGPSTHNTPALCTISRIWNEAESRMPAVAWTNMTCRQLVNRTPWITCDKAYCQLCLILAAVANNHDDDSCEIVTYVNWLTGWYEAASWHLN